MEKVFLTLLKNALNVEKNTVDITDINELFELGKVHTCMPLVYLGASRAGVAVPESWIDLIAAVTTRNYKNLVVQQFVLEKLKAAGISCAVLKGAGVAVNYPEPLYRQFGDIDILVKEESYDDAITILTGSKERIKERADHRFHYHFDIKDIEVEIHRYMSEYGDDETGEKLEAVLANALNETRELKYDCFVFPALKTEYQAASLLLHTRRHLYENRLNIRLLCDWTAFINSVEKEEWEKVVKPFISELGLFKFANILNSVCSKYLGADCEGKIDGAVSDELCESLIEEFLDSKIAVKESELSDNVANIYARYRAKSNVAVAYIYTMNDIARRKYKYVRKYPILMPVSWVSIFTNYVVKLMLGKSKKFKVKGIRNSVDRRTLIFEHLEQN